MPSPSSLALARKINAQEWWSERELAELVEAYAEGVAREAVEVCIKVLQGKIRIEEVEG